MDYDAIRYTYVKSGEHRLFAAFHAAVRGDAGKSSVLVCAPWGWAEVASYRPRRAWAQELAAAGHPTLRFDLPATGNSSGTPGDPGLAAAWVDAVGAAAAWLRETSGRPVTALGLGIGGLLALEALRGESAIDGLALWGAPTTGAEFVKETKTFSRFLARLRKLHGTDEGEAGGCLPDGWLESSGFALSPETVAGLERMEPLTDLTTGPRRALLISRHRNQRLEPLAEQLRAVGTETELTDGKGWGAMVSEPAEARLSREVSQKLGDWLAADAAPAATAPAAAPVEDVAELEAVVGGTAVIETETSLGSTFGILAEPAESDLTTDLCAVFLNSGAVRSIGPNRMWVERSRAWAAKGIPSLRVDLDEIGEGAGDPDGIPPGNEHFSEEYDRQVSRVLDALSDRGLGPRFVVVGLCSGAYHALRAALGDDRVEAALMINAGVMVFRPEILDQRDLGKELATFDRKRIAKLFSGEVGPRRVWELAKSLVRGFVTFVLARLRGATKRSWGEELDEELDGARASGTRLLVAFSAKEVTFEELAAIGFPQRAGSGRWPNLRLEELPGNDHTLRPTEAQQAAAVMLDTYLDDEIKWNTKKVKVRQ